MPFEVPIADLECDWEELDCGDTMTLENFEPTHVRDDGALLMQDGNRYYTCSEWEGDKPPQEYAVGRVRALECPPGQSMTPQERHAIERLLFDILGQYFLLLNESNSLSHTHSNARYMQIQLLALSGLFDGVAKRLELQLNIK